jgi:2-succinyl-5-enolpyruvyl-6-hydroxy-3-cyclohexene-1-carboxylate synthase
VTLQQSVLSPGVVQATFAATLFDEWCRHGLSDVVVCPGSRSTPLALAADRRSELRVHVRVDERSAGFFALGRALATKRPVALVVTSGTAAAELHAAVAEADLAGVALLVLTADRPPELHGVGAAQSISQRYLFGDKVRRFEEPGVARQDASWSWRPLASRLWADAYGGARPPGPVHLNAAFVEPLTLAPAELPAPRALGRAWHVSVPEPTPVVSFDVAGGRVLAVVGAGVDRATVDECVGLDWVVVGDATAQGTLAYFDALLRDDDFADEARPDVVVRLGGLPASKALAERLRGWRCRVVAFDGAGPVADPDGLVGETLRGLVDAGAPPMRGDAAYRTRWVEASRRVGAWLESNLDSDLALSEPVVARLLVQASGQLGVPLVVGSSMPVRDVEWWAPSRERDTYANRGANGIDGVVSTLLGVAAGGVALGLVGDITMLHDVSGLVDGLGDAGGRCVLVVADNQGGGIFSFLAQASTLEPGPFERLFATPRRHDLVAVARAFGYQSEMVKTPAQLRTAIEAALGAPGLSVVVAQVPTRDENVRLHDTLNEAVRMSRRDWAR